MPSKYNNKYKRILIIGSLPYFSDSQSRAFDSYFHYYPTSNIRQIFTSRRVPKKGHCDELMQITDASLLKRFFRKIDIGTIYHRDNLEEQNASNSSVAELDYFYRIGKKKTPLMRLFRKILWRRKFWCTKKVIDWVDEFSPNAVFFAWSDDFYSFDMVDYFSRRYKIPIISCIGDDYIFNKHFSVNPFYYVYRHMYLKRCNNILFDKLNREIYISSKIADYYNAFFKKNGTPIYVSPDELMNEDDKTMYKWETRKISYIGNVAYGRFDTLKRFMKYANKNNCGVTLDVYSNLTKKQIREIKSIANMKYCGFVDYSKIKKIQKEYDATIVCESLNKQNYIKDVRFSLSTKISDSLSGNNIVIGIGNPETGAIDFLQKNKCALIISDLLRVKEELLKLEDDSYLLSLKKNAVKTISTIFNKKKNCQKFEKIVEEL